MEEIEAKEIDLNFIQPYLKKKEKEREIISSSTHMSWKSIEFQY